MSDPRRWATAAGELTSRALTAALDGLEDVALRGLEQAAAEVAEERLRLTEQRLRALRAFAAPAPRLGGRLVAGTVYFAARWAPEAVRSARDILGEAADFLDHEDPER